MKVLGYTRVSSNKQDLHKQEHLLLKYAPQKDLRINDFIRVEISSRWDTKERRIDELLDWLDDGDVLLVAELSRLGRNMFEVIDIINQLGENGVEVIFVRQPELSTAGKIVWQDIKMPGTWSKTSLGRPLPCSIERVIFVHIAEHYRISFWQWGSDGGPQNCTTTIKDQTPYSPPATWYGP